MTKYYYQQLIYFYDDVGKEYSTYSNNIESINYKSNFIIRQKCVEKVREISYILWYGVYMDLKLLIRNYDIKYLEKIINDIHMNTGKILRVEYANELIVCWNSRSRT